MTSYVCAVDVGTRSARAGIFTPDGAMIARAVAGFDVFEGADHVAEYASDEIWSAVCSAVQRALSEANISKNKVHGLAFDATCSLVLRDADGKSLALGSDGRDTIAWFDHRATAEAEFCTKTGHPLIQHLGGTMSPEMQTPKLMWLKRHRPGIWSKLGYARDLADDLTYRATGRATCSNNTLAVKWAFLPAAGGWQTDFLASLDLSDLVHRAGLPDSPILIGKDVGGLAEKAAGDLGLPIGTPVAAGLIDAYAGALGALSGSEITETQTHLTLITGTSTCVLATTNNAHRAVGVWGPFADAIVPGKYCCEGGLSAAGALLDHVIASWPGQAEGARPTHDDVARRLKELLAANGIGYADHVQILPDFNGNRTPFADPAIKGVVSGMTLDRSFDTLCGIYWRAAIALTLGTRQIIEHMADAGIQAPELTVSGGFSRSPMLLQLHADVLGTTVRRHHSHDVVLLGGAMSAAAAAGVHPDLPSAVSAMASHSSLIAPDRATKPYYNHQYALFQLMQQQRDELAQLQSQFTQMEGSAAKPRTSRPAR